MKPCQFYSNVTLLWLYSTDIEESLLHLDLIEVLDGINLQILKSVREYLCNGWKAVLRTYFLSLDVCGHGNSESRRGYKS